MRRGRRVLVVTSNWDAVKDGVVHTLHTAVRYIQREHREILLGVVTTANVPAVPAPRVEHLHRTSLVIEAPLTKYAMGMAESETYDFLERFDPDVVHVASPCLLASAVLDWATRYPGAREVRKLATFHTDFAGQVQASMGPRSLGIRIMVDATWTALGALYRKADLVLAPTPTMRRQLVYDADLDPERVEVWGHGVDLERFGPHRRDPTFRAETLNAPDEDTCVVVYVGRLAPEKNLDAVAAVFRGLAAAGKDFVGVFVGEGPEAPRLRHALADLRAAGRVVFTGLLHGDALAAAYASADVFLFPSVSETFGCVTVEAMASGLPVIGGRGGGTVDVVRDPKEGRLFEPDDHHGMLAQAIQWVDDPDERRATGARALEGSRRFLWGPVLERLANLYNGF